MKKEIVNTFNADNEEPKCCMCDYCGCEFICEDCGPEHGWQNYERKEFLDLEEDESEEVEIFYAVYLINYPTNEEAEYFADEQSAVDYAKQNENDYDAVIVDKISTDYIDKEDHDIIYKSDKEQLDEDL